MQFQLPQVLVPRCTPFAVITDQETGIKYPLADYALLPNMAIVDTDNMHDRQPRGLTSCIRRRRHDPRTSRPTLSVMASDYTEGLCT